MLQQSPSKTTRFGKRLRKLRVAARISARELSLRIGASHSWVSNVERLWGAPSAKHAQGLSEALGVELSWLLNGTGDPPSPAAVAERFRSPARSAA